MPKTPRAYQLADAERAIEEFGGRVLLRHRPGIGKTEISTLICGDLSHRPCVIICRTHLVLHWVRHLLEEYPGCRIGSVVVDRGNGRWRELSKDEKVAMLSLRPPYDFYVLTYSTIRRVKRTAANKREAAGAKTVKQIWNDIAEEKGWVEPKKVKATGFEYRLPPCRALIVDESHVARRVDSQQYHGLYQLAVPTKSRKAADHVVLLTATPKWREFDDLYAQFRLLDPKRFNSYWEFVNRYCIVEETEYGTKVIGGRKKRIARLYEKYTIYRDYKDPEVGIAVPDIIPEEVLSFLSDKGEMAYADLEDSLAADRESGFKTGSGVSDFFKITATDPAKLKDLDAVVEGIDPDEPYAVFAWYQDTVAMLARRLELPYFTGTKGGTNRYTRSDAIAGAGSFVATIGCVQEGIDLSHIRTAIAYESDYTYGAMEQLRSRFARWRKDNSTDPVRWITIAAAGSVDEIAHEASKGRGASERDVLDEIIKRAQRRKEGAPA